MLTGKPFILPIRIAGPSLWLVLSSALGCTKPCESEGTYVKVVAGADGACGLDTDGWATCWGDAATGAVLDEPFGAIDLEYSLVCGITTSGANVCWGDDVPGVVPPSGDFVDVAVSKQSACWLGSDGLLTCVGEPCAAGSYECSAPPSETQLVSVVGGLYSFCGADQAGAVSCWGGGPYGVDTVTTAPGGLAEGWNNLCVVTDAGDVDCTYVPNGTDGSEIDYGAGTIATGPGPWTALTAGNFFACVLDGDGRLQCSGMYDEPDQAVPAPEGPFLSIAAGHSTSQAAPMLCASFAAGGISCWTNPDSVIGVIGDVCDSPWAAEIY